MSSGTRDPPRYAGNNRPSAVEPFYTNEDVAVLHDIVFLAQEILPSLPENQRLPTAALFEAYYDILPRNGINIDHDNRYARVLFKIGGLRGDGTLYEKFEEIMSRMGIDIEFDIAPDSDVYEESVHASLEATEAVMLQDENEENIAPPSKARRKSDSAWDLGSETPAKLHRRNSYSSFNKARVAPLQDRRGFVREVLQQQPSNQLPKEEREIPENNVGAWLNAKPAPLRRQRGRSISTQPGMRIRRRSPSITAGHPPPTATTSNPNSDENHTESEITAVTSALEVDHEDSVELLQGPIPSQPSADLMQTKAEIFLRHRLNSKTQRRLQNWHDQAVQRRAYNANLQSIAYEHDKNALLMQALDTWHNRVLVKRNVIETARFFAHLERRAVLARDIYYLHKAFTHWHGVALEEAERTRAARRHILRTRMFNAWRDITAVKELKVRRQVLKKFFGIWQRNNANLNEQHNVAVQKFEGNLAERILRQWLGKVWDIKATKWWADGLKHRSLLVWNLSARKILDGNRTAEDERRLQLAWNAWRIWNSKVAEYINQNHQAVTFRRTYLCINSLRKWRGETKVIPAKKVLQTEVGIRQLRHTFAIWLQRSRQERQAAAVDRMRILREGWTKIRHEHRLRIMAARIDYRVTWDAFYNLKLAAKKKLKEASSSKQLLRNAIQHWAKQARESRSLSWEQESLAMTFSTQKMQGIALKHWLARSQHQQQLVASAQDIYAARLLRGVLSKLSERIPHFRQLQHWSRDAEFYFLTSRTLKRWKVLAEASKREKRKAAYAQVRRTTKINLGRGVVLGWRSKTQQLISIQAQAQEIARNKDVIVGMNIFDRWRARTEEVGEIKAKWQDIFLRKYFDTWRDRSIAFQDLKKEAIYSYQERRQNRAIKKWKLAVLQIRGRSIQAIEIEEKNAKRTFRRMFNYWHQKALERRPVHRIEVAKVRELAQLGATGRAEAWSDFGDEEGDIVKGFEDPIAFTPLPGYMSTPSRRTERVAAAAARFSSTTPRAPLSTPFERHLRAQYSGGSSSVRRPPGRSALRLEGGFLDIAGRSTQDEGRR